MFHEVTPSFNSRRSYKLVLGPPSEGQRVTRAHVDWTGPRPMSQTKIEIGLEYSGPAQKEPRFTTVFCGPSYGRPCVCARTHGYAPHGFGSTLNNFQAGSAINQLQVAQDLSRRGSKSCSTQVNNGKQCECMGTSTEGHVARDQTCDGIVSS
jgi:hypothetical protein